MTTKFKYADFERELNSSGLGKEFSAADMALARSDPDAGMSILNYKKDWHNATTAEAKALANMGAERIRSGQGKYTGGETGGSFYMNDLSPQGFEGKAAPTYESRYDERIKGLMDELLNRKKFEYNAETDPLYSQYRKQYAREGQRATQDALGAAAAASGGIPSSYALTAATQAGDYYAAQMTDKIPELYQQAYDRYLKEYQMKLSDLETVQGAEQRDYGRYLDQLGQYNTDRSFDYGVLLDEIGNRRQERQDALDYANLAGQYGYNKPLNDLGISTDNNPTDREREYQMALLGAEYGDFSGLEKLGIKPNAEGLYNFSARAAGKSATGGSTGRSGGSSGSSSSGGGMKLSVAKDYAKQGLFNDDVVQAFKDAGYSEEYLKQVYGYEPSETNPSNNYNGVDVDGERLSYSEVLSLVEAGEIEETTDEDGNLVYHRVRRTPLGSAISGATRFGR